MLQRTAVITPKEFWNWYNWRKSVFVFDGAKYNVNVDSQRYSLFALNSKCVSCGLEASHFALEYIDSPKQKPKTTSNARHFNMYGIMNDLEVLFTKDHIIPRSLGGRDQADNYQTMCLLCNSFKASNVDFIAEPTDIARGRREKILTNISVLNQYLKVQPNNTQHAKNLLVRFQDLEWLDERL